MRIYNSLCLTLRRTEGPSRRVLVPNHGFFSGLEEILRPAGVVVLARQPVHQVLGRDVFQVGRRGAVPERLHGLVDGLDGGGEGLMPLQADAHAQGAEIVQVDEGFVAAADDEGQGDLGANGVKIAA